VDLNEPKPGDPVPDSNWFRTLAAAARRRLRLSVLPPLTIAKMGGGQVIGMADVRPIKAQLSGSTSPYSWVEVSPGTRSGTGNAYELNAKSGLGGTIQWLNQSSIRDYDFQAVTKCNTIPPPPCSTGVTVFGCCASRGVWFPVVGATVTLTLGATTVSTCTTDSNGTCTLTYTSAGTYTITVTATGWQSASYTFTCTSPSFCCQNYHSFQLQPPSGQTCVPRWICPAGQYPYIPRTITLNDGLGDFTLTTPTPVMNCPPIYQGCVLRTAIASPLTTTSVASAMCGDCYGRTLSVPVQWTYWPDYFNDGSMVGSLQYQIPFCCTCGTGVPCGPPLPPGAKGGVPLAITCAQLNAFFCSGSYCIDPSAVFGSCSVASGNLARVGTMQCQPFHDAYAASGLGPPASCIWGASMSVDIHG
jgi:hypothetical protein